MVYYSYYLQTNKQTMYNIPMDIPLKIKLSFSSVTHDSKHDSIHCDVGIEQILLHIQQTEPQPYYFLKDCKSIRLTWVDVVMKQAQLMTNKLLVGRRECTTVMLFIIPKSANGRLSPSRIVSVKQILCVKLQSAKAIWHILKNILASTFNVLQKAATFSNG